MRKSILVGLAIILSAVSARAQTTAGEQVFTSRVRVVFNVPGTDSLDVGGDSIFRGLFKIETDPALADNQVVQSPALQFRTKYDSNTAAGITNARDAFQIFGMRPSQIGTPYLRFDYNGVEQFGVIDGGYMISGRASSPGLSASGKARWYYDTSTGKLRLSLNAGAYTDVLVSGQAVTSVALAMPSIFAVSGSPVTSTGTLTASLQNQTANTIFAGPSTGAAAAPSFRSLVTADYGTGTVTTGSIADGTITFADWNQNSCASGNIPKWNGSAWACAGDDTSPGGTSWLTTGNTAAANGSFIGTLNNFTWDMRVNNVIQAQVGASAVNFTNAITFSNSTANFIAASAPSSAGADFGFYRFSNRTSTLPTIGATQSAIIMDNGILKVNQANAGWVNLLGANSWLTAGNTLGAAGSKVGSLDNFDWTIVRNNVSLATALTAGLRFDKAIAFPALGGANDIAIDLGASSNAISTGWIQFINRSSVLPAVGGSTGAIVMDNGILKANQGGAGWVPILGQGPAHVTLASFTPNQAEQPASAFGSLVVRNNHPALAFDAAIDETVYFTGTMNEQYSGGSLDVQIIWTSATAVTGNTVWEAAIEMFDLTTDLDADSFGTAVTATQTAPGTSGQARVAVITLTNAQADAITAGTAFRVRVRRLGTNVGDTMAGDAHLLAVHVRQ